MTKAPDKTSESNGRSARERRRAEALRANLRRRKAQAKARKGEGGKAGSADSPGRRDEDVD